MAHSEKCSRDAWHNNEALLQSYRALFIPSQSLLLVVGAIASGKGHGLLYTIAAISLVMIWAVWFPVVRARHLLVDYHKFGSRLSATEQQQLCSVDQYLARRSLRRQANALLGIRHNWRETRVKLDALMPALMSAIWLALLIYESTDA